MDVLHLTDILKDTETWRSHKPHRKKRQNQAKHTLSGETETSDTGGITSNKQIYFFCSLPTHRESFTAGVARGAAAPSAAPGLTAKQVHRVLGQTHSPAPNLGSHWVSRDPAPSCSHPASSRGNLDLSEVAKTGLYFKGLLAKQTSTQQRPLPADTQAT